MSETSFSINDLVRRKLQTSLVIISFTLCVASTLFLLLFAQRIGFGISLTTEAKLTAGFSEMFSPFMTMLTILIFAAGAVLISFTAYIMISQKTRDIGLMKVAGCPNDMLFGYFFAELMFVAFLGCLLGTILGVVLDIALTGVLSGLGLQLSQQAMDLWTPFVVFIVFFVLSLVLGGVSIFSATGAEPAKVFSPEYYFGLSKEPGFHVLSKSSLTLKLAVRMLVRHKSAAIRVVVCLSTVFFLITVAVAGGMIAQDTTRSWVEGAVGRNTVLIAHQDVVDRYKVLLSKFYEGGNDNHFNYTDDKYLIPTDLVDKLRLYCGNVNIEERLVLEAPVKEVEGIILGSNTGETQSVGDSRQGESLVVGVDQNNLLSNWSLNGIFLEKNQDSEAVIGDSLAHELFSMPLNQSIKIYGHEFNIVGVCFDPLNNGNVTYVSISALQNIVSVSRPNVIMMQIDPSSNITEDLIKVNEAIIASNATDLKVFQLDAVLDKDLSFLGSIWSTIMFLPVLSIVTASLSLVGYVVLTINEQRQELGILRALGAKPKTIFAIVSLQSLIVLLASCAVGIAFGTIATLLILVQNPIVTPYTVVEIAGWLLLALTVIFVSSIYPALKLARKPLLETMAQS